MTRSGFKDTDGVDLGYKFVPKDSVYSNSKSTRRTSGGELWMWGRNCFGQMGINSATATFFSSPVQTISGGSNWKQVSAADYRIAAVKTDGTLWNWGRGTTGKLGDNTATSKSSPVQTVARGTNWKQVSVGCVTTHAVKTDGTLWGWGQNTYNTLGVAGGNRSSPVQTTTGGTDWKKVSVGPSCRTFALKCNGTLWVNGSQDMTVSGCTWCDIAGAGFNLVGGAILVGCDGTLKTCGTWEISGRSSTYLVAGTTAVAETDTGGSDWKKVFGDQSSVSAIALKTDGSIWAWDRNRNYRLGVVDYSLYNTYVCCANIMRPTKIPFGSDWICLATSADNTNRGATAAIKTDGTLWNWGLLCFTGTGIISGIASSPIQNIIGGSNWKSVAAGRSITAAIRGVDEEIDE